MNDHGESTARPMAAVKKEDGNEHPSTAEAQSTPQHLDSNLSKAARLIPSNISPTWTTDLELLPHFKAIFEQTKALRPDVVQKRHSEFLLAEEKGDHSLVQEADQVKLYGIFEPGANDF
jgi:hypothetical protein